MQIQLAWDDPATGEHQSPTLTVPIAFGREFARMPATLEGQQVTRIVLESGQVSRFHALIQPDGSGLVVVDQNSANGVFVNGNRQSRSFLANGDVVQIGPYHISVITNAASTPPPPAGGRGSTIIFHPETDLPVPPLPTPPATPTVAPFPPAIFQAQHISLQELAATGFPVQEYDYAALGAGLGSFIWVNLLRIGGVKADRIVALGIESKPYARYQRLCLNSQIPARERLRSNSDSCPDNIWGWPSYALREAWHDFSHARIGASFRHLWQVFGEPTFAETYTPRSGNVFASIDREADRIGWNQIYQYGRIRAIRKTDDGRYVIAYSRASANRRDYGYIVAKYVHLATGYPGIQVLPDLQDYREKNRDFKSVVNAYEEHEHVYKHLAEFGGTVMIRGRGIVASRIVQRIYEIRQKNSKVALLHLLRSPKPQGNRFGKAQRAVKNFYELQPFNWPKACWGGDLRVMLEKATPEQRQHLLKDWGGTTTADRKDWQKIAQDGLAQGWYQVVFGEVEKVEPDGQGGTLTYIQERNFKGKIQLQADYIIDATGLDAKVETNPLLDDLLKHYHLPINPLGRLAVSNDFELPEMQSGQGKMYAAGAMTLGGPYAAVDSFLGLQYAALRSVDHLAKHRSPSLRRINGLGSFCQWLKWVFNLSPR
ncbi:FHA domain-containing protein [Egbenema bharatensis]|uniref:FHA domain-containing protein n=1 Tax=Egbenema bharatensis TaxID=3463334 RepID=UPI003A886DA1